MRTFLAQDLPVLVLAFTCACLPCPHASAHTPPQRIDSATGATVTGWTTHSDPLGFSVDLPPGWTLTPDHKGGLVALRGPRGEQTVIWPQFVEQRQVDSRSATILVQQIARTVDPLLPWAAVAASAGAVRAVGRGPQQTGTAVLTWSPAANGTTILFYCVEAPAGSYRASTDTFAEILKSFRTRL